MWTFGSSRNSKGRVRDGTTATRSSLTLCATVAFQGQNAAVITCEHAGEIGIFGTGAGGDATAVAILGDLAAIARDRAAIVPAPKLTGNFRFKSSDSRILEADRRFAEAV